MKNLKSHVDYKNETRRGEPEECDCKLCKDFVSNLGYVNLVWLWLWHVNLAWFQVLGNAYHVSIFLLGVGIGKLQQSVKYVQG